MTPYSAQMETHIASQSQSQSQSQYQSSSVGIDEAVTASGEIRSHWKYLLESLQSGKPFQLKGVAVVIQILHHRAHVFPYIMRQHKFIVQ